MAFVDSMQIEDHRYTTLSLISRSANDLTWMMHASCKGRTELFFPPRAERPQARMRREAHARLLCSTCPVQRQCQQFARDEHEYGFWGGESEEDRYLAGYTVAAPIGVRARACAN